MLVIHHPMKEPLIKSTLLTLYSLQGLVEMGVYGEIVVNGEHVQQHV